MSFDWKALAPHRPLRVQDVSGAYVPRPTGGADEIAATLRASFDRPVAVAGPAGSGKSTELAALAAALHDDTVTWIARSDRAYDPKLDAESVLGQLGADLVGWARATLALGFSSELRRAESHIRANLPAAMRGSILLKAACREVRDSSRQGRFALLVDGVEKIAPYDRAVAVAVVRELAELRSEAAVVVVVPPGLVIGPDSYDVLSEFRVVSLGPVLANTDGMPDELKHEATVEAVAGQDFLMAIAARRLGHSGAWGDLDPIVRRAARGCGGAPRAFLQVLQDAAGYAERADRELPIGEDVERALADQADTLFRLLRDGDRGALRAADGTDGAEVPLARRVRFLNHGLLLEHRFSDRVVCTVTPPLRSKVL